MSKEYSASEAAALLGVHRSRVHALRKAGRLKGRKTPLGYLYTLADLKPVRERRNGRPPKST